MYHGSIPEEDVEKDAMYLGVTATDFAEQYLGGKDSEGNYQTKHTPCDFLMEDGSCKLGDCKPESCKKYPLDLFCTFDRKTQSLCNVV